MGLSRPLANTIIKLCRTKINYRPKIIKATCTQKFNYRPRGKCKIYCSRKRWISDRKIIIHRNSYEALRREHA